MFMKDADGNTIEEIGIANWKVEHIEEFRASPPHTLEATHAPRRPSAANPRSAARHFSHLAFCPVPVAEKLAPAATA